MEHVQCLVFGIDVRSTATSLSALTIQKSRVYPCLSNGESNQFHLVCAMNHIKSD